MKGVLLLKKLTRLIILILVCVLLGSCTPQGGEVTTDQSASPTPETSVITPDTTVSETEEITTEDITAEETPAVTEPPSVFEAKVYVYNALGVAEEFIIKTPSLPSAALESVDLNIGENIRAELLGWEYSTAKDGSRMPYDTNDPPHVTFEGMHIYPILEYSYRVRFLAGGGRFPEGTRTEFFIKAGERARADALLAAMPERDGDEATVYVFSGFSSDTGDVAADGEFTVDRAIDLTAVYLERDAIYKVSIRTEYGELPGGGKKADFEGNLAECEQFVAKYRDHGYPDIRIGGLLYKYSGMTVKKNGGKWNADLKWDCVSVGYTVVFDYGEGQQAVNSGIAEKQLIILPTVPRREDDLRYYDFVGWRDSRGHLYNGGYELTVTEDMTFSAEFADGEKKIYSIVFDTEIGNFSNGSPVVVVEGCYGDPLTPPAPPSADELTFGDVVYEFTGWSAELPAVIERDLNFTAMYKTEKTVYFLNFYVDGELYLSVPYYVGSKLTEPNAPEGIEGKVFSGWTDMPLVMPESDLDLFATTRDPEIVYVLDCEIVSSFPAKCGTLVTLAEPAHKYGHTVSGWYTADIERFDGNSFTMPAHDVVFDATSAPNRHTVRYLLCGTEVYCDHVLYGDIYTLRGIEVKLGHKFSGWAYADMPHIYPDGIISIPDSDIVLIGNFAKSEYKINYYIDGELVYSDSYFYGDKVTVRPVEEQPGCVFAWHSAGADISLGSFMMPAGNVDVYGMFSSGDNAILFSIDGEYCGSISVNAGEKIDLGYLPTKQGFVFSGWSCDEVDVESGVFIMPEGDIVLRGSFIPNVHDIIFIDIATEEVFNTSHLDYGSRFSIGDSIFCTAGRISEGWVLLDGHALPEGDGYVMPDSDVVFGIVWNECLTVEVEEGYHVPYYALITDEFEGCRYNEETKTVYVSDPAIKVNGASEGISVVYEYGIQ